MTPDFCKAFLLALEIIDHRLPKGVVVSTSGITKFYSNGLDFAAATRTKGFFEDSLYPLWRRLLTCVLLLRCLDPANPVLPSYPMPTIALINGHAFAAGAMTAMMHDYRIMNPHRGYFCLNELDFGALLKPAMASIFRQKLRPDTFRTMILESKRFSALEAVKEGIVDGVGSWENTVAFVQEMKLLGRADTGVYGKLKEEMWRETVQFLDRKDAEDVAEWDLRTQSADLKSRNAIHLIEEWETRNGRTKL